MRYGCATAQTRPPTIVIGPRSWTASALQGRRSVPCRRRSLAMLVAISELTQTSCAGECCWDDTPCASAKGHTSQLRIASWTAPCPRNDENASSCRARGRSRSSPPSRLGRRSESSRSPHDSANGLPATRAGTRSWPRINAGRSRGAGRRAPIAAQERVCEQAEDRPEVPERDRRREAASRNRETGPRCRARWRSCARSPGAWRYVEYGAHGSRYSVIGQGTFCQSCHAQARANDYVFTRR